jgi:hypothetical protein
MTEETIVLLAIQKEDADERDLSGQEIEDALPLAPADRRLQGQQIVSRDSNAADFLLLREDSALKSAGVGGDLPSYVGARPPSGGADWDWEETWKKRREAP